MELKFKPGQIIKVLDNEASRYSSLVCYYPNLIGEKLKIRAVTGPYTDCFTEKFGKYILWFETHHHGLHSNGAELVQKSHLPDYL